MPRIKMGRVLGGREPSVRSVSWCKRVQTKFEPYVANGAHRANANMGIYSPVIRPTIKNHPRRGVFFIMDRQFGIAKQTFIYHCNCANENNRL